MRRSHRRVLVGAALGLVALLLAATAVAKGVTSFSAGPMSDIPRSVSPGIGSAQRLDPLPKQQQIALDVVLRGQRRPGSARLVLASSTVRELIAFLADHKLGVVAGAQTPDSLTATGTVQDVEGAFRVHLFKWRERATGRVFFANDGPIAIPSQLSPSVIGVLGLNNYPHPSPAHSPATPTSPNLLSPQEMQRAYGVRPLLASLSCAGHACDGTGQGVAIFATGGFSIDDVNKFSDDSKLSPLHLVVRAWNQTMTGFKPTPNPPSNDSAEQEAEMDIEAVHAFAPGASIHVYEFPQTPDVAPFVRELHAFFSAALLNLDQDPDNVLSISYADCEHRFAGSDLYSLDQDLQDVTLSSRSVFAASGDNGKYCPIAGINPSVDVMFPASDPQVTAVGGTSLTTTLAGSYLQEAAWDTPQGASGGGFGSSFPRRDWQGQIGQRGENRLVPDVAATADPQAFTLAIYAYQHVRLPCVGAIFLGNDCWQAGSGTSLAAPLWAGFAAVYNNYAQAHAKGTLGFANPALYYLASHPHQLTLGALTDITANPSRTVDLAGPAGPGWDAATGLGSFDAAAFVHDRLDQHLSLLPPAGPNGTDVLATATGFPPGEAIGFSVGGGPMACTATTNSTGTASCSLNVHWNIALGPQVGVDATDGLALLSAATTFQAKQVANPSPSGYATAEQAAQAAANAWLKKVAAGAPSAAASSCSINLGTPTFGVDAAYFAGMACGPSAPGLYTYVYKDANGWHYLDARSAQAGFMPGIGLQGNLQLSSGCANVRETPGLSGRVLACIGTGSGTTVTVDGGPNYVDQKIWWHLQGMGWMAHDVLICAQQGALDALLPAAC